MMTLTKQLHIIDINNNERTSYLYGTIVDHVFVGWFSPLMLLCVLTSAQEY